MKYARPMNGGAGANRRASFETTKQFYHSAAAPATTNSIREALNHLIVEPDQVVELRILNTSKGTVSGYFTNLDALAVAANHWSGKAPAVYITVNPVLPDLLARTCNRVRHYVKATTADGEILRRVWLLIDFDAKRPADISSTDAEHDAALVRAQQCREWLRSQGWSDPIYANSGNGAHLDYRIELANDTESEALLKRCLQSLALRFDDDAVIVDQKVYNAGRIWKLYGTMVCKGDDMPERPHRMARILEAPEALEIISIEQLQALAAQLPEEPKRERPKIDRGSYPGTDRYVQAALANEKARVQQSVSGTRNDTLNKAAFALGQLIISSALDRGTIEDELLDAAQDIGLVRSEALKTICSGIEAGMREPREIPEPKTNRSSKSEAKSDSNLVGHLTIR